MPREIDAIKWVIFIQQIEELRTIICAASQGPEADLYNTAVTWEKAPVTKVKNRSSWCYMRKSISTMVNNKSRTAITWEIELFRKLTIRAEQVYMRKTLFRTVNNL